MTFRTTLSPEDPARIERLVARTGVFNAEEIEIARSLAEETLAEGPAAGYAFLIADGAEGIEGYTCFGAIPGTDRRYELYWIAVDPASQKRGLARALLDATEHEVAAQGGVILYAETSGLPSYGPAHRFYERAGYGCLATIPDYHADGDSLIVYGKRLPPPR